MFQVKWVNFGTDFGILDNDTFVFHKKCKVWTSRMIIQLNLNFYFGKFRNIFHASQLQFIYNCKINILWTWTMDRLFSINCKPYFDINFELIIESWLSRHESSNSDDEGVQIISVTLDQSALQYLISELVFSPLKITQVTIHLVQ